MNYSQSLRSLAIVLTLACVVVASTGCGGYTLRGRVIQGTTPSVEIVHQMDARLRSPAGGGPVSSPNQTALMPEGAGVGNVEVTLYRDPNTPNQRLADRIRSSGEGNFTLHLGGFGAGWMEEKWQVVSMNTGYANTVNTLKLPVNPDKFRLLITIAPGTATPPEQDVMEQFDQFK